MAITAVEYTYDASLSEERANRLAEHRAWLTGLKDSDRLVEAGLYPDGSGALLIFDFENEDAAYDELKNDPYAKANLIAATQVKRWGVRWGAIAALAG